MSQKEIDPRVVRICKNVYLGTMSNIILSLEKQNLAIKISENDDYELCGKLTQEGFNQITDATFVGLGYIFEQSRINLLSYKSIDEKKFADLLVNQAGLPKIRSQPSKNQLEIEFIGNIPLIRQITSYLNPEICQAKHVKNIRINKVAIIIESSDHLN